MNLTESEIETLKHEAESLDMQWHENYQGRWMVKSPYAISGNRHQYNSLLTNLISMLKYAALDDEVDEADGYENIVTWLLETRLDNLGNDFIWY